MHPQQLSHQLREEHTPDLDRRRQLIELSMLGMAMGQLVALYQTGIIPDLPDPPGPFDASRVDASDYAFKRMNTPDGFMMITNYAITAWLAAAGGKNRARQNPLLPIALGAKTLFDSAIAVKLAQEEWSENKAFCEYCQVATLASLASAAIAVPEAMSAAQTWLKK